MLTAALQPLGLGSRPTAPPCTLEENDVDLPTKPAVPALDTTMANIAAGDRAAFAQLYDAFAGPVHGTVLRIVRSPEHAEEVTQEIFVEVWEKASRWERSRGSAAAWILTIARRRAVDRVRREQAARDRTDRVAPTWVDAPSDDVAEEVITRDQHARVRSHLAALTPLQREAIELAYFGDRTYREVAELLDVPLGTVKTRMRDGLKRLQNAFGELP